MLRGRSCQDATLIWGLGDGFLLLPTWAPYEFLFLDHSGRTVGTGYMEGEGKCCGGSGN